MTVAPLELLLSVALLTWAAVEGGGRVGESEAVPALISLAWCSRTTR